MRRFLILLVLATGCSDDDDGGGGGGDDTPAAQGSCFYSCNTVLGTSYGCTSNAQIASSSTCDSNAASKCGSANDVGRNEFAASCTLCAASCAPSWYKP